MTPEQINMAIAEARGWVWYKIPARPIHGPRNYRCLFLPAVHEYEGQSKEWIVRADMTESICNWVFMQKEGHVQNYHGDLNAMHEAESAIDNWVEYLGNLWKVVNPSRELSAVHPQNFYAKNIVMATAAQRAEAFLRTLGKMEGLNQGRFQTEKTGDVIGPEDQHHVTRSSPQVTGIEV